MSFLKRLGRQALSYQPLHINQSQCIRAQSPLAHCRRCEDVCPVDALTYSHGRWVIADHCTQCGYCVASCPMEALEWEQTNPLKADDTTHNLLLSCIHDASSQTLPNRINCFQSLRAENLAWWVTRFHKVILYADCKGCRNRWFPEGLTMRLKQLHIPYENKLHIVRDRKNLAPWLPMQVERRDFLKQSLSDAQHTGQNVLKHLLEDVTTHLEVNEEEPVGCDEKHRTMQYLQETYRTQDGVSDTLTVPYPRLQNRGCHFCTACVRVCPTQALSISENQDESQKLVYSPVRCTRCELCFDVCFNKGFQWGEQMRVADIRHDTEQVLARAAVHTCMDCGEPHYDSNEGIRCHICEQKKT